MTTLAVTFALLAILVSSIKGHFQAQLPYELVLSWLQGGLAVAGLCAIAIRFV